MGPARTNGLETVGAADSCELSREDTFLVLYTQPQETKSSRRAFVASGIAAGAILASPRASLAVIDINNAIAGDFQRYPGLFPTIAAKVIQKGPFKNKEEMYAAMENDAIVERLKQYEKEFTFNPRSAGSVDRGSGKRSI